MNVALGTCVSGGLGSAGEWLDSMVMEDPRTLFQPEQFPEDFIEAILLIQE